MPIHPRDLHSTPSHLTIRWEDEHESVYSFAALRAYCPCAACRMTTPAEIHGRIGRGPIYPTEAEEMGRYAIRLTWSDGHDAGIYPWEYLRSLCPCERCQREPAVGSPER